MEALITPYYRAPLCLDAGSVQIHPQNIKVCSVISSITDCLCVSNVWSKSENPNTLNELWFFICYRGAQKQKKNLLNCWGVRALHKDGGQRNQNHLDPERRREEGEWGKMLQCWMRSLLQVRQKWNKTAKSPKWLILLRCLTPFPVNPNDINHHSSFSSFSMKTLTATLKHTPSSNYCCGIHSSALPSQITSPSFTLPCGVPQGHDQTIRVSTSGF